MRKARWLLVPAILLVIVAVVLIAARAVLSPARVRSLVEPRLEAALRRPVDIGAVRVSTVPLAVRVDDVRIAAPPGFASPDLLRLGTLELYPRILPLLSRRIAIRSVRVRAPEAWVEQRADSVWNWATAPRVTPPPPGATAPGGSPKGLDLAVEKLEIEAGRLHLTNAPAALGVVLPFAAEIGFRADRALHDVRLSGWLDADSIRVASGARPPFRLPRLRLEPDIRIDVPESTATVERLGLVVNRATIDIKGTARMRAGKPELHLATRSEAVDLAELLAALPADAGAARGVKATGTVRFDLKADVLPGARPVVRGTVALRDGSLQAAQLPEKVSDLALQLAFAGDSLRIEDASARIADAPVRLSGLVLDAMLPARARYDVQVTAGLDLARLGRVAPLPPGVSLAGHADIDVRARGRVARPDSVAIVGPVALRDVVVRTPQLAQPVQIDARLQGTGAALRVESMRLGAGPTTITATGAVWPALPPRRPRVDLQATTPRLDLAALLPKTPPAAAAAPGRAADTTTAVARNVAPLLPVLPPADLHLQLAAREVVLQGATMQDAHVDLRSAGNAADAELRAANLRAGQTTLYDANGTLRIERNVGRGRLRAARATLDRIQVTALESDLEIDGRTVRLPNLRGRAYEGQLAGTAMMDLSDPARPRTEFDATADKLQASAFLASIAPALGGTVSGTLDLKSGWKFAGSDPQLVRQTLSGVGHAAAVNGRIVEIPVASQLASLLKVPSLRDIPYRDLGMQFSVESGRLAMRDFALRGSDADVGAAGSIGLDGSLDLGLQVTLSQEVSRRALGNRGAAALGALFTDSSGRLVFDVRVGGTHRAPKLQLDLQKTASRGGLSALTGDLVGRLLGGRTPPPPAAGDTTRTTGAADDPQKRAIDEARKRLGGLLGGTKAPADTSRRP